MLGDKRALKRSLAFVSFLLLVSLAGVFAFTYTDQVFNITITSDRDSYSCYPGCVAYINITNNNASLNGVYNVSFSNTVTINESFINFTIYSCTQDLSACTEIQNSNITNFNFTNGTDYPFKLEINLSKPLYGKWNFTFKININGTVYNITLDPYIDSINLTSPQEGNHTNSSQPLFEFVYTSAYNTSLNCTLFINSTRYPYGSTNASNATTSNITANATLSDSLYAWFVGCDSDGDSVADEFSESRNITIDKTSPSITNLSPSNASKTYKRNESGYTNFTVQFSYTETYPALYEINIYNSTNDIVHSASNTSNITSGSSSAAENISVSLLPDGLYDIEVIMHDIAGNSNSTRENDSLVVDSTNPLVSIASPTASSPSYRKTENSSINFTVNISYTETNPSYYRVIVYNSTGSAVYNSTNSTAIASGSSYSLHNVSISPVPSDGKYDVYVKLHDLAGNYNTTRQNDSLVIDNTNPSVELATVNYLWDADGSVSLSYNFTDFSGAENCSLWMTNSSGGNWSLVMYNQTTVSNASQNSFSVSGLDNGTNENGTYTWNVKCIDMAGNSAFASSNRTLYIGNRSDLVVYDIIFYPSSPYAGQKINITVRIRNIGTASVSNVTNVSITYGSYTNKSAVVPALSPGAEYNVTYYNITALSGNNSVTAIADYADNWTMERYPANNTRTEYLSTNLNVTVLNVVTYGSYIEPGEKVTYNISVKLYNGTPITGLTASNITYFYDAYSGRSDWDRKDNISGFTEKGNGIYTFNYTVPLNDYERRNTATSTLRIAESGNHSTKLMFTAKYGGTYTGWSNNTEIYSITAPRLEVQFYGVDTTLSYPSGNTDVINVRARNTGTEDMTNITVKIQSNSSGYKVENSQTLTCSYSSTLKNSSSTWTNLECNGNTNLDAAASAVGTYKLSVIAAYGISILQSVKYNSTSLDYEVITVSNSSSSSSSSSTSDSESGSSSEDSDECSADSDCSDNEECISGTCVTLSCAEGYSALNHECVQNTYSYALKIVEITEKIEVVQGENATISFKIKNIGNITTNVKINATSSLDGVEMPIDKKTYHILKPYMSYKSTLSVNATEEAEVGEGIITFSAFDKDRKDVRAEYNITLLVHPNEKTKKLINTTYESYLKMFNKFFTDFKTIKASDAPEENYTKLNRTFITLERMLNVVKDKLSEGDYIGAKKLLRDADAILSEAEQNLENLKTAKEVITKKKSAGYYMWIIGAIILLIIAGLFVYLLLPPKTGYSIKSGYRAARSGRDEIIEKAKGVISRIKGGRGYSKSPAKAQRTIYHFKKTSYMPGYERQTSMYSIYKNKNSPLQNIKRIIKRKK